MLKKVEFPRFIESKTDIFELSPPRNAESKLDIYAGITISHWLTQHLFDHMAGTFRPPEVCNQLNYSWFILLTFHYANGNVTLERRLIHSD